MVSPKGNRTCQNRIHENLESTNEHLDPRASQTDSKPQKLRLKSTIRMKKAGRAGSSCVLVRTCSDQKSRGILTELKKQIERQEMGDRVHVYTATCLSHVYGRR